MAAARKKELPPSRKGVKSAFKTLVSGRAIHNVDAPLSGAWHVLWGPTGTPWGRAEGCAM
eukprot:scaffold6494_cov39-Phaeocystis_antarctica.AAC.1